MTIFLSVFFTYIFIASPRIATFGSAEIVSARFAFYPRLRIHCRAVVQGGAAGRRARRGAPAPLSLHSLSGARAKMPRPLESSRGIGHRKTEKGDEIAEGATQTTGIPLFTTWCQSCCNGRRPPIPGRKTAM